MAGLSGASRDESLRLFAAVARNARSRSAAATAASGAGEELGAGLDDGLDDDGKLAGGLLVAGSLAEESDFVVVEDEPGIG